ncbi:high affinity copper uptake protein 1 [Eupeodes corollae]|uniref:high affinity copper uptake protein 1 n=1 Tax=Eupeodes corollae TaxID=290404 RepID=UPI00249356E0|nr:high affinity copper uptake protein 1 [Eupeodes corollae]
MDHGDHGMDHGGMDHGGMDHGGHGDGSSDSRTCPMIMTFHGGHCERILWKSWLAYTLTEFIFSALAIFAVAFAYEGIKFVREYHLRKVLKEESDRLRALNSKNCMTNEGSSSNTPLHVAYQLNYFQRIFNTPHILQTCLNLVQIILSYLLMLIFMTFNYWLCLAVILGLGLGYFVFGWIKQDVYETECCH